MHYPSPSCIQGLILLGIVVMWIKSAASLNLQFTALEGQQQRERLEDAKLAAAEAEKAASAPETPPASAATAAAAPAAE